MVTNGLAFLIQHFFDLQVGVALAPAWALFIFGPPWMPRNPIAVLCLGPGTIILLYLWMRFVQRVYKHKFGSMQGKAYLPPTWSFLIPVLYGLTYLVSHRAIRLPNNFLALLLTCFLVHQIVAPLNPTIRRCYYAAGTLVTFSVFLSLWVPVPFIQSLSWPSQQIPLLGLTMMTVSFLDHWLLLKSFKDVRRALHA
jgi:hypothetical protein